MKSHETDFIASLLWRDGFYWDFPELQGCRIGCHFQQGEFSHGKKAGGAVPPPCKWVGQEGLGRMRICERKAVSSLLETLQKKRTRGSCSQHVECHQLQHCALQEGEGTLTWPVCNPADKSTDRQTHTALMNHGSHMECTQDGRTYEGQWASALSRTWRTMHWSWALQDASQGQWKAAWHGCGDNLQGQPRNLKWKSTVKHVKYLLYHLSWTHGLTSVLVSGFPIPWLKKWFSFRERAEKATGRMASRDLNWTQYLKCHNYGQAPDFTCSGLSTGSTPTKWLALTLLQLVSPGFPWVVKKLCPKNLHCKIS